MSYLNIVNPHDRNKTDWVQIPGKNKVPKSKETKLVKDVGGIFTKLRAEGKSIDAGELQAALAKKGIRVSTDPEMTPNGITSGSAGILVALEDTLTDEIVETVEETIVELTKRPKVERTPIVPGAKPKENKQYGEIN